MIEIYDVIQGIYDLRFKIKKEHNREPKIVIYIDNESWYGLMYDKDIMKYVSIESINEKFMGYEIKRVLSDTEYLHIVEYES